MRALKLELGGDDKVRSCDCCSRRTTTAHGFVYADGDAFAVYYAGWSEGHRERGVTMAIAIGEWDTGSTVSQRICAGIEAYEGERDILFRFIDPASSPWPSTGLLGPMISCGVAVTQVRRAEFLAVAELVVREHPGVARFLGAT